MECRKCGRDLPEEQFECINPEKGWRRRECRECVYRRHKAREDTSKLAILEYNRAYYRKNKSKLDKRKADWDKANPERRRQHALSHYYRLQDAAIMAYGGYRCSWCGIDEPLVLCLDHIDNGGNQHRKAIKSTGGHLFYKWLRDNSYPTGFQVLCMNCNHAKYRNGGVLPETLKGRCNDHPERE